jgi:fructose-specific phosphotransferase system IIC component
MASRGERLQNLKKHQEIKKMKNMRNIVAAIVMLTILSVSTTFADGVILQRNDGTKSSSCVQTSKNNVGRMAVSFAKILVAGFTGIMIADRSGLLISDRSSCDQSRDGIMIAD